MSSSLPIEAMTVRVLSVPLDEPVPMSFAALSARTSVLVTLRSGGLAGTGESWVNHPPWAWRERVATLAGLRDAVVGADAYDPPALLDRLSATVAGIARQWGAPGPLWQALSGIDMAAWDLLGKVRNRSVAVLLADRAGGTAATRVGAYASGIGPTAVAELTERALALGLTAVKARVGFGAETDRATLAAVRDVAGTGVEVFADANQAWDLPAAQRMCDVLGEYGVGFVEEPLAGDRPDELRALAERTGMRLAGGENVYGTEAYAARLPWLAHVQPDASKTGGVSLADAVGRLPGDAWLSPHCYGGVATLAASVHLAASAPRPGRVELDVRPNPLRTDLGTGPRLCDGDLVVPAGPGLGVEYDDALLDRYTVMEDSAC